MVAFLQRSPSFQDFTNPRAINDPWAKPASNDILIAEDGGVKSVGKDASNDSLNQKTWHAFEKAVNQFFSTNKRGHICARYGLDWEKMIHSNHPLERRYVDFFRVGAASAYTYNLKESLAQNSLFNLWTLGGRSVKEIQKLVSHATRFGYNEGGDPRKVSGAPSAFHENLVQDDLIMDEQRCNLFDGIANLISKDPRIPSMHPYYSRLTMGIISLLETEKRIKDIKMIIPAPGATPGELDYYKVHDIIAFGGLSAIALVPVSKSSPLPPILTFRCTQQALTRADAIPSLLNDMEKNMGESGYKECEKALSRLMKDVSFTRGKKIIVCAYSLGGSQETYFVRDHLEDIKEVICFNTVGNDAKVVEDLANQINALPEDRIPPSFYLYRNISTKDGKLEDWVNKSGQKHIGWGIKHPNSIVQLIEWIIDDYPAPNQNVLDPRQWMTWLNLHAVRPMDSDREYAFNIYRGSTLCDPILNTYARDRTVEDARLKLSYLNNIISFFYNFLDLIFNLYGIEFFKKNMR